MINTFSHRVFLWYFEARWYFYDTFKLITNNGFPEEEKKYIKVFPT